MNDEIDPSQSHVGRAVLAGIFRLAPGIGGFLMVAVIAVTFLNIYLIQPHFCPAPAEPEGPHCADAKGNATCVEYYGADQPYCDRSVVVFHGCVTKPPTGRDAAFCGALAEGLPDDPTCSKVIADYVPRSDEPRAICKVMSVIERLPGIIGIFLAVACTVCCIGYVVIRPIVLRIQVEREVRAQITAARFKQPKPSKAESRTEKATSASSAQPASATKEQQMNQETVPTTEPTFADGEQHRTVDSVDTDRS